MRTKKREAVKKKHDVKDCRHLTYGLIIIKSLISYN